MRGTCVCDVYANICIKNCSAQKPLSLLLKSPLRFIWGSKAGRLLIFAARRVVSKRFL